MIANMRITVLDNGLHATAFDRFHGDPEIVDHQPARLVAEDPVDAGDRLHQSVAAHRLVNIYLMQAGRVETGEPHVARRPARFPVPMLAEVTAHPENRQIDAPRSQDADALGQFVDHHALVHAIVDRHLTTWTPPSRKQSSSSSANSSAAPTR